MIRGNEIVVDINKVLPNDYNPKLSIEESVENKSTYEKIKASLQNNEQFQALLVREVKENYEIVDGKHRWLAMKELGYKECSVRNLGKITRNEAIKLTLSSEELKIALDDIMVAKLVQELANAKDLTGLPYTEKEIEAMLALLQFNVAEQIKEGDVFNQAKNEFLNGATDAGFSDEQATFLYNKCRRDII